MVGEGASRASARITGMRFVQAGTQQLIALDPDHSVIRNVVKQAGFDCTIRDETRRLVLEVRPSSPQDVLLLFDASDPANMGWFSRCQFYVDSASGRVLQTPIVISNCSDADGKVLPKLRISVLKELPASFQMPGRQNVSEQVVYSLLYNLLAALKETGVAVCGQGGIRPLAGRAPAIDRQ
jgi:hypothetical protein